MSVDEIFALVAQNIQKSIPVGEWEKAELFVRVDDSSAGIKGSYWSEGEAHSLPVHDFDWEVEFALMDLHEIMTPEDQSNPWNRAVVTLLPSGEFNMEFSMTEEDE